jgi:hypothetical protein
MYQNTNSLLPNSEVNTSKFNALNKYSLSYVILFVAISIFTYIYPLFINPLFIGYFALGFYAYSAFIFFINTWFVIKISKYTKSDPKIFSINIAILFFSFVLLIISSFFRIQFIPDAVFFYAIYYFVLISPIIIVWLFQAFRFRSLRILLSFFISILIIFAVMFLLYNYLIQREIVVEQKMSQVSAEKEKEELCTKNSNIVGDIIGDPGYFYDFEEVACKPEVAKILDLSNQKITDLQTQWLAFPKDIAQFKNLEILCLDNLNINEVPADIVQLGNLKFLDLSGNPIKSIPLDLLGLKQLEGIDISNTNIDTETINSIKSEFPQIKIISDSSINLNNSTCPQTADNLTGFINEDKNNLTKPEFAIDNSVIIVKRGQSGIVNGEIYNTSGYTYHSKDGSVSLPSVDGLNVEYTLTPLIEPAGIISYGKYVGQFFKINVAKTVPVGSYNGEFYLTLTRNDTNSEIKDNGIPINYDKEFDTKFTIIVQ